MIEHCVPSTDGWSERGYYTCARELLAAICRSPSSHWSKYLSLAEFATNNAVNASMAIHLLS